VPFGSVPHNQTLIDDQLNKPVPRGAGIKNNMRLCGTDPNGT
jgi:hypothetical protein